ncbi:MAG: amidase [Candidatus Bathyarchaeota archaeon]|nr:amidase [Candidatus Bathyarchaeota archaeon]
MKPYMLSLTEATQAIKKGTLTPREYTESLLERINTTEPAIHAWVTIETEKLLEAADRATETKPMNRLHGVPIGVKDIYSTAGTRTTMGSPIYRDNIPDTDAAMVQKIKEKGAIVLGKTETTEFALHDPAPTTNPWNTHHTPGGSSSGSAAAVATGMCPVAFGSQTGGSVVRPASYCGIVGVKPTYDLLSREGVYPLAWSLDHIGYMTRTVEDAHHMLAALTDSDKQWSLPEKPPRIGVLRSYFKENAQEEVWDGYEKTIAKLWGEGAEIIEASLPESFKLVPDVHRVIMAVEVAAVHEDQIRTKQDDYGDFIRGFIMSGLLVPATAYLRAQRLRGTIIEDMKKLIDQYDCVICPSTTDTAPEGLAWTGSPAFNAPWSLTGFPSITIPSGLAPNGLPLGLQLVGTPLSEWSLLKIAGWCFDKIGFDTRPRDPYTP